MPTETAEAARLRREISRLTSRACVSTNIEYLRNRFAALSKLAERGGRMPNEGSPDPAVPVSVSLTASRVKLLDRICDEKQLRTSRVMTEAFDTWCRTHGYTVEINHITRITDRKTT